MSPSLLAPETQLDESHTCVCDHCGLPMARHHQADADGRRFCCAGCREVYHAVTACGLGDYYRLRALAGAALEPAAPGSCEFDLFDSEGFHRTYVRNVEGGLKSVDLRLEGVTCGACLWLIERLPTVVEGVSEARVSLGRATARITWNPATVRLSAICRVIDGFGYVPHPATAAGREQAYRSELRKRLMHLGIGGAIAGNLMLLAAAQYAGWYGGMEASFQRFFRILSAVLGILTLVWPGRAFFTSAWSALRARHINLDVPISMALFAGGVGGLVNTISGRGELYFDSLATLVFLLLVGRFIQFRQQRRAENSLELMLSLTPRSCTVVRPDGRRESVPAETVAAGDLVEVTAGGLIPADGVVEFGASNIDQSLLTGESVPVEVGAGANVLGGTRNGPGVLRIRLTSALQHSRVGRLMETVASGMLQKPAIVRFSDRVGVVFTIAVTLAAAATLAAWWVASPSSAVAHAVAMLIVTCPCVLGLATPMTLAMAIGQLARRDILVKSGVALETLATAKGRLILDKTGTLTTGRLKVGRYAGDESLRAVVAAAERMSNHPVARAVADGLTDGDTGNVAATISSVSEAGDGGLTVRFSGEQSPLYIGTESYCRRHGATTVAEAVAGVVAISHDSSGRANVNTVCVASRGVIRAVITLHDQLRDDAPTALRWLDSHGLHPEIASGDAQGCVNDVATASGVCITRAKGGLQPEQKLDLVSRAVKDGPVVMVGDGVNDAAALAAATVGIAVHGGAETALSAADIYLARPGLSPLVDLVRTARRTMRVIHINFGISLGYNLLAGGLAATGHMNPLAAAILMPASSLTVLAFAGIAMRLGERPVTRTLQQAVTS